MFKKIGIAKNGRCELCGLPIVRNDPIYDCPGCGRSFIFQKKKRILIEDYFDPQKIINFDDTIGFSSVYQKALEEDMKNRDSAKNSARMGMVANFLGSYEKWHEISQMTMRQGNLEEALFATFQALHDYPQNPGFWFLITDVFMDIDWLDMAEKGVSVIKMLKDRVPQQWMLMLDNKMNSLKKHIYEKKKQDRSFNNAAHSIAILSAHNFQCGNHIRGEKRLKQSISIDENCEAALGNLGVFYTSKGDLQNAKKCYEKILSRNKNSINTLYNLGNVYVDLQDFDKALSFITKAVNLDPTNNRMKNQLLKLKNHLNITD